MDKDKIKEMLEEALGKLKGDTVSEENAAKFAEHLDSITEIVAEIKEAFGDGLDLSDLTVIGKKLKAAVKSGKLTKKQAWAKWIAITKGK